MQKKTRKKSRGNLKRRKNKFHCSNRKDRII